MLPQRLLTHLAALALRRVLATSLLKTRCASAYCMGCNNFAGVLCLDKEEWHNMQVSSLDPARIS